MLVVVEAVVRFRVVFYKRIRARRLPKFTFHSAPGSNSVLFRLQLVLDRISRTNDSKTLSLESPDAALEAALRMVVAESQVHRV